jgi:hypothetical protein
MEKISHIGKKGVEQLLLPRISLEKSVEPSKSRSP